MCHNNNYNNVQGNRHNYNKGKEIQENFRYESYKHQLNVILKGLGSKSCAKVIDNEMQPSNKFGEQLIH